MASPQFKKTLFVRFIAYLAVCIGFLGIVFQFGPLLYSEVNYRKDRVLGIKHTLSPIIITSATRPGASAAPQSSDNPQPTPTSSDTGGSSGFGSIIGLAPQTITPVSTDYGIVIEKINANAKVVANVDPAKENEYAIALTKGVAQAKGSTPPGEPGNTYIFSHSADAPWNIIRFNAVFYLLRELEQGDRIIVFYQGRRFDYIVFDKTVTKPDDVSFINNRYDKPVLTLQTCDPPGTLRNRLIVRAKLAGS